MIPQLARRSGRLRRFSKDLNISPASSSYRILFEVIHLAEENINPKQSADTITLSKDMLYGLAVVVLAALLVLSVFTQGFGFVKCQATQCPACNNNGTGGTGGTGGAGGTGGTAPNDSTTLTAPSTLADAPLKGPAGSAITVVEFSDFQCPFCGMTWGSSWATAYADRYGPIIGTVKKMEVEFVDTGKVAFRHFPVAFLGQESIDSSNAAMCADAQGKYWEMHDAIFAAQTAEENNGKYSKPNLKILAQNVTGLDQAAFGSCLDADTYTSVVQEFTSDWGATSKANTGSSGTPTFWILVDAAKVSEGKVSTAATAGGFEWGPTSDGKTYVILASPEYASIKATLDALLN
jgi:protein-disulfide isomerase